MGRRAAWVVLAGVSVCVAGPVAAGAHTWTVHELFSNADGTIQFIELLEANGGVAENGVGSAGVRSVATGKISDGCPNPSGSTSNKRYLVATPAFAALPGAPTPNCVLSGVDATNFFSNVADTVRYGPQNPPLTPYDQTSFVAGELPTDGLRSFYKGGTTAKATPTNFAGQSFAPPGVSNLLLGKSAADLSFDWDEGCLGAARYHIVYGLQSDLPTVPGGVFSLQLPGAGQCAITAPPVVLTGIGDPTPGGFFWYLVLADNGGVLEGSWGLDSAGTQRKGPVGLSGHSGQCGMTGRSVVNICGN